MRIRWLEGLAQVGAWHDLGLEKILKPLRKCTFCSPFSKSLMGGWMYVSSSVVKSTLKSILESK